MNAAAPSLTAVHELVTSWDHDPEKHRRGYNTVCEVPGHPDLWLVDDGATSALYQRLGRSAEQMLDDVSDIERWDDAPGLIEDDA